MRYVAIAVAALAVGWLMWGTFVEEERATGKATAAHEQEEGLARAEDQGAGARDIAAGLVKVHWVYRG